MEFHPPCTHVPTEPSLLFLPASPLQPCHLSHLPRVLPVQGAMTALRERSYFRNKPLERGHWGFLLSYLHQAQREDPAFLLLTAWNSCSWKRGVSSLRLHLPLDIPAAASRLWWGAETCREEWWGCQKSKSSIKIFLSPLVFICAQREVQRGVTTAVT